MIASVIKIAKIPEQRRPNSINLSSILRRKFFASRGLTSDFSNFVIVGNLITLIFFAYSNDTQFCQINEKKLN